MANEIKLVTYANSEVTPQNDAVLTNLEIASNGVIFGCNVTIKNASTLHINAGMGVVYGREFEIVDSDIPVSLSSSGTLLGQLYVHIDLANTSEPAQLLVDTGNSLTPLVDDPTINITTGSTDYQLATFTVDTSTLANLTETFSIVNNPSALIGNTDISGIGDGTLTGAVSQLNTDLSYKYHNQASGTTSIDISSLIASAKSIMLAVSTNDDSASVYEEIPIKEVTSMGTTKIVTMGSAPYTGIGNTILARIVLRHPNSATYTVEVTNAIYGTSALTNQILKVYYK